MKGEDACAAESSGDFSSLSASETRGIALLRMENSARETIANTNATLGCWNFVIPKTPMNTPMKEIERNIISDLRFLRLCPGNRGEMAKSTKTKTASGVTTTLKNPGVTAIS
ncbi:unannotated protein [freshwater metagenome]|uniref:Unannotated protein n=1 Tax=freshwater metagenome TaxID=449393 RepID=A0A6J5ZJN2_9ZZZZ